VFRVSVHITPKEGILDPQGATVERSLPALGFRGVTSVRVGRFITLEVEGEEEGAVREEVESMCRQLLANPTIEDYSYDLEEVTPTVTGTEAGGDAE